MNQDASARESDPVEAAIVGRLSRLASRPVDLTRLQQRIEAEIPRQAQESRGRFQWRAWVGRPLRAVAALLMVGVTIAALLLASSSGPALASPIALAQLHESVVAHDGTALASMEVANAALAGQWPQAPALPDVPDEQVMSCCIQKLGRARAACVLLKVDGQRVTMAAADAADVRMPDRPRTQRGGTAFQVEATGSLNMVMTRRDGKWYCLIGPLPAERLMDFWSALAR